MYQTGLFVSSFAIVETSLLNLLTLEAGVSPNIAKAVFSGVKIDQAKSHIKRAREATEKPDSELLDRVFSHLTILTNLRNDLLHHGTEPIKGEDQISGFISNEMRAMPGKHYEYTITTADLRHANDDLRTILAGIFSLMADARFQSHQRERIVNQLRPMTDRPWSYRSIPRSRNRQQPREDDQA